MHGQPEHNLKSRSLRPGRHGDDGRRREKPDKAGRDAARQLASRFHIQPAWTSAESDAAVCAAQEWQLGQAEEKGIHHHDDRRSAIARHQYQQPEREADEQTADLALVS